MRNQVLGVATQVPVMAIVILLVLLFVGIGIIVVIHICMVGRAFRRGFGNRNSSNNMVVERGELGSRSMSREELPCFDFKAKEIKGATPSPSPADCAVCLEDFKAGEKCRLLPLCCHSFHAECVDMWLLRTALCPICRGSADFDRAVEESSRYVAAGVRRDQFNIASGTEVGT
ncbi:RING-H2 finger protein ATL74-like [Coffea arabica]|uniref:RING-H2 finger protein ATL74-like n=1 Tax=Coffea arabica TaxID=13443 RepID=A0ABM4VAA0_COFAR